MLDRRVIASQDPVGTAAAKPADRAASHTSPAGAWAWTARAASVSVPAAGHRARAALDGHLGHRPDLLRVRQDPLLARGPADLMPVMATFGGATEIRKEIIARGLGL